MNPKAAQLAIMFLTERRIAFEEPAYVHAGTEGISEVIFSSPGARTFARSRPAGRLRQRPHTELPV